VYSCSSNSSSAVVARGDVDQRVDDVSPFVVVLEAAQQFGRASPYPGVVAAPQVADELLRVARPFEFVQRHYERL